MNRFRSLLVLLATALAAGCGSDDSRLTVLLKDAPATTVQKAWVTITDVNLIGPNGITRLGPNAADGSRKAVTVNLLDLAASTATVVDNKIVPPGTYMDLRFVLSGGCILADGQYYASSPNTDMDTKCASAGTLRMPSMEQSGLKVMMSGNSLDVASGSNGVLLVDFDVAQSFGVEAGGSGAWVMHPVITGGEMAISANVPVTVATTGATAPASLICTVSMTSTTDSTVVSSTIVGGIGKAQLYPPAGTYTAAIVCTGATITSTAQAPSNPITVNAGQVTPISFTIGL